VEPRPRRNHVRVLYECCAYSYSYSYGAVCSIPFAITYRDNLRPERSDLSLLDDGHGDDMKSNDKGLGRFALIAPNMCEYMNIAEVP
jgi:hypothetical protein